MTLDEIKDNVAKETVKREFSDIYDVIHHVYYADWKELIDAREDMEEVFWPIVCKRYAFEVAKATLENVKRKGINVIYTGDPIQYADADLSKITDESNIVL